MPLEDDDDDDGTAEDVDEDGAGPPNSPPNSPEPPLLLVLPLIWPVVDDGKVNRPDDDIVAEVDDDIEEEEEDEGADRGIVMEVGPASIERDIPASDEATSEIDKLLSRLPSPKLSPGDVGIPIWLMNDSSPGENPSEPCTMPTPSDENSPEP